MTGTHPTGLLNSTETLTGTTVAPMSTRRTMLQNGKSRRVFWLQDEIVQDLPIPSAGLPVELSLAVD